MKRLRRRFPWMRRLQWTLTVSYALVTAVAVLLISIVVTGGLLLTQPPYTPVVLAEGLLEFAPQMAPYLRPPPDRAGLAQWLNGEEIMFNGTTGSETMAVANAAGMVLATFRWTDLPVGAALANQISPQAQPLLASALQGNSIPNQIATWGPNGEMITVLPIKDTQGRVLGVWYVEQNRAPFLTLGDTAFLGVALVLLSGSVFVFALVIGMAFGFLVARGLTQRLQRLVVAADGWSQGNFGVTVQDRSGDELGQLAQRLNSMANQLRTLLAVREALATSEERNRLARDLHDAVKQQLFAASMQVAAARALLNGQHPAADQRLIEAERLATSAQDELGSIISQLRPAALDKQGLVPALHEYVGVWSRQTGIAADVQHEGERALPLALQYVLFRVAQEALANVARHSSATRVEIKLCAAADHITLEIQDNGHGFDTTLGHAGMGLNSMRERMLALGGRFTITSRPGIGTVITVQSAVQTPAQQGDPR